jgi:hypothetical protein
LNEAFKGVFKIVKSIIKIGIIFIVGFIVVICFSMIFKSYTEVFLNVYGMILMNYILLKSLVFTSWVNEKIEIEKLKRRQSNKNDNNILLFQLMSHGYLDHSFIFNSLNEKAEGDLLDNLKRCKTKIRNLVGPKMGDYYLIRNYVDMHIQNNLLSKISKILLGFSIAVLTGILTKIGVSEKVLVQLGEYFNTSGSGNNKELILLIIDCGSYLISFIFFVIYMISEFTKDKRRNEFIKVILDSIIEEKEEK